MPGPEGAHGGVQAQLLVVPPGPGVDPVGVAATMAVVLACAPAGGRTSAAPSAAAAAAPAAARGAPATAAGGAPTSAAGATPAAATRAAPAAACKAGTRLRLLRGADVP